MNTVGIDLHKRIIVICVMNDKREVVDRKRFSNEETKAMEEYFRGLGEFQAVVEATGTYEWLYTLVKPLAKRLVLAHPKKLRIIAESTRKSDKVDAQVLALFLALDMIPPAHCPSPEIREYRRWVRLRHGIQRRITSVKNRMRAVLARYNADREDLFTQAGRNGLGRMKVSAADRWALERYREELELLEKQLERTEEAIEEYVKQASPAVQEGRAVLQTIPGVGPVTADVVLSELGEVERFSSQKKGCAYAGLIPSHRQSGEREKRGSITKEGSPLLRWALVEAAWRVIRYSAKWRRIYERLLASTRQKKKAIVAVARRLLCVMMAMVRNGCSYSAAV